MCGAGAVMTVEQVEDVMAAQGAQVEQLQAQLLRSKEEAGGGKQILLAALEHIGVLEATYTQRLGEWAELIQEKQFEVERLGRELQKQEQGGGAETPHPTWEAAPCCTMLHHAAPCCARLH